MVNTDKSPRTNASVHRVKMREGHEENTQKLSQKNKAYKFHSVKDNDRRKDGEKPTFTKTKKKYLLHNRKMCRKSDSRESHFLSFHCQSLC